MDFDAAFFLRNVWITKFKCVYTRTKQNKTAEKKSCTLMEFECQNARISPVSFFPQNILT